jgi:uncharacterized protein (TIRG00374 family)
VNLPSVPQHMPSWLDGRRYGALLCSVVLAAAAYLATVLWTGWDEVSQAVAAIGFSGLAIALLLSLVNYGLRFIRWQQYLRVLGHPLAWRPSLQIYLAGFALTTTPGKAGELLRSVLLQRHHMPFTQSLTAFLSERLSDLLAVTALTLFGFLLYPQAQLLIFSSAAILLALYWLVLQGSLLRWLSIGLQRFLWLSRWLNRLQLLFEQVRLCHTPALMTGATALSLVAWGAEAWAFHLILEMLGYQIPAAIAIFIYAIAMLAGALSFMPGGLGGAEAMMIALLTWQGVSSGPAVAATLIIRLATLWFAVLLGLVALLGLKKPQPASI